jgi:hypothetical protein
MIVETYLTYEEMSGRRSTFDEFRAELSRFPSDVILRACSALNILLFGWSRHFDKDLHDRIVRILCPAAWEVINRNALKVVLHRQVLLLVAKEALRIGPHSVPSPPLIPDMTRLFTMANDQLAGGPTEEGARTTIELISRFMSVSEFQFAHPAIRLSRPFVMLAKFAELMPDEGKQFHIPEMFEKATGMSPEVYFPLVMGCMTKYVNFGLEQFMPSSPDFALGFEWFNATNLSKEQLELFFTDLSGDHDEFHELFKRLDRGVSDFSIFRERPIVRLGDRFLPIDFSFLVAKSESAFFWRAQSSVPNRERENFHAFWGALFEQYMHRMLKQAVDQKISRYFASPCYVDRPSDQACDGIMLCKGYAVFIEFKGSMFRADAKWSGDTALLEREIRTKLVGEDDGDRKGVRQLANAISEVFGHKRVLIGVDLSGISKVYPVVVTYDEIGDAWFLAKYLNEELKKVVNRRKLRVKITPTFSMSADQLERLAGTFKSIAFTDILDGRYKQEPSLKMPFGLPNNPAFKDLKKLEPAATVDEGAAELMREATRLFPNE